MRVSVEKDRCVGSGQCVLAVAAVFDQNEENGIVTLRTDQPAEELAGDVEQAALVCPARAITVTW
jgi:ferredoxin